MLAIPPLRATPMSPSASSALMPLVMVSRERLSESKLNGAAHGSGHNSGEREPMANESAAALTEKVDLLREQIAMAIAAQRVAGVAPSAIGRLGNLQRVKALRSSYLLGAVRFCRRNPLADTRLAILAYVTFLSDNPFGTCRLSVTRMCRRRSCWPPCCWICRGDEGNRQTRGCRAGAWP
jgi:hypothetical protein